MNLAVGFFDGVHRGHCRILIRADEALTLSVHPLSVLAPDRAPPLLMTEEERKAAICASLKSGGGRVRSLAFTRETAAGAPAAFADWLKRWYPELDTLFCGKNWTFGAGGKGNAAFLRAQGFKVVVVPLEKWCGEPVSSTRIRTALAAGDLLAANAMLGHSFTADGFIVPGKGLGRQMGFPTANVRPLNPDLGRLLPPGVYDVHTNYGRGVANWGRAPTMGADAWTENVLEVHILVRVKDRAGWLPPQGRLKVEFNRFMRPERKFASVEELRRQIAADVRSVRVRESWTRRPRNIFKDI